MVYTRAFNHSFLNLEQGYFMLCFAWENHSKRVSSFLFLSHGGYGAAITKKLEQKGRKLVLQVEEISIFWPGY